MLDSELTRAGTVLMHAGEINLDGFEADGCTCREELKNGSEGPTANEPRRD